MNKFTVVAVIAALIAGCTTPGQRIADQEMTLGVKQAHTVYNDMGRLVRQHVLDKAAADVESAMAAGDVDAARAAVQNLFNAMQHVDWLDVQWERARAVLRDAHGYIIEQQGVLSLYAEEWEEASKRIDGK